MTLVVGSDLWQASLSTVFLNALDRAGEALRTMSDQRVEVESANVRMCGVGEVVAQVGSPDDVVVGVYLGITGSLHGHALLLLTPDGARRFAGLLLEGVLEPSDALAGPDGDVVLSAMETSALQELGNVTIAACLNELGKYFEEAVHPTVPQAIVEFAGAILDAVLLDLVTDVDQVLAAGTRFTIGGETIDGTILILPDAPSLARLAEAVASHAR
jgi:chemotaxis protein CheC